MPPPIYSTQFFHVAALSTSVSILVPAGHVYIARDLDCYFRGGSDCTIRLLNAAGGTLWVGVLPGDLNPHFAMWRGRQVFRSGQTVAVTADATCDVALSGYDLTSP